MGAMQGFRQVSLYIDPKLYQQAKLAAAASNRVIYEFVNDAIRQEIERSTTPAQRKSMETLLVKEPSDEATEARPTKRDSHRRRKQSQSA